MENARIFVRNRWKSRPTSPNKPFIVRGPETRRLMIYTKREKRHRIVDASNTAAIAYTQEKNFNTFQPVIMPSAR